MLFVGIIYSMRGLLSDLNNYVRPANWRYASDTVTDVSARRPIDPAMGNSFRSHSKPGTRHKYQAIPHVFNTGEPGFKTPVF